MYVDFTATKRSVFSFPSFSLCADCQSASIYARKRLSVFRKVNCITLFVKTFGLAYHKKCLSEHNLNKINLHTPIDTESEQNGLSNSLGFYCCLFPKTLDNIQTWGFHHVLEYFVLLEKMYKWCQDPREEAILFSVKILHRFCDRLTNSHLISFRLLINFLRDPNDQQLRIAFFPVEEKRLLKAGKGKKKADLTVLGD